jgi:hypothetical protein
VQPHQSENNINVGGVEDEEELSGEDIVEEEDDSDGEDFQGEGSCEEEESKTNNEAGYPHHRGGGIMMHKDP